MDSLADRARRAKQQLLLQAPRLVLTYAGDGLALVRLRIQRDGLPGRSYSTNPIPGFWLEPTNAAGRAYVKKEKRPTYKGLRQAQGMETRFVNLTYTGAQWRSLIAAPAGLSGAIATARIVASDAENAQKLQYNLKREGDFLAPNAQERALLNKSLNLAADRIIQQAFQS